MATYIGKDNVDKIGSFSGTIDFELVAAWLDTQLIPQYPPVYGEGVEDAERLVLTIVRPDRTVVIQSLSTYNMPVTLQGVVAAMDGFGDSVRWKPASALDSFEGYFLDESKPGVLTNLELRQFRSAESQGIYYEIDPDHCKSVGEQLDVRLFGSRAVGSQRSYQTTDYRQKELGPPISVNVRASDITLSVGNRHYQKIFRRVSFREFWTAIEKIGLRFRACSPPSPR